MPPDTTRRRFVGSVGLAATTVLAGCRGDRDDAVADPTGTAIPGEETVTDARTPRGGMGLEHDIGRNRDPETAPLAKVDRFSEATGTLLVRGDENGLPGPNEPVDFDQPPFLTRGLGPDGGHVSYYNFDVQRSSPASMYVLFREGEDTPVDGQLNVVDAVPGDEEYNDFWQIHEVTVPDSYDANSVTSVQAIEETGFEVTARDTLVNYPVVPEGSTASMRIGDGQADLVEGWYNNFVVFYFEFPEVPLTTNGDTVPVSPMWVTFNRNPSEEGGGQPSGFRTESRSDRTHNVVATLPGDDGYSPFWLVNIYDNADFETVFDRSSARDATQLVSGAATVNCPVVSVSQPESAALTDHR